jgi:hypothetical protein
VLQGSPMINIPSVQKSMPASPPILVSIDAPLDLASETVTFDAAGYDKANGCCRDVSFGLACRGPLAHGRRSGTMNLMLHLDCVALANHCAYPPNRVLLQAAAPFIYFLLYLLSRRPTCICEDCTRRCSCPLAPDLTPASLPRARELSCPTLPPRLPCTEQ